MPVGMPPIQLRYGEVETGDEDLTCHFGSACGWLKKAALPAIGASARRLACVRRCALVRLEPSRDRLDEVMSINGLGEEVVAARGKAFRPIVTHGVCRQGHHGAIVTLIAKFSRGLVAIEDRHLHVH